MQNGALLAEVDADRAQGMLDDGSAAGGMRAKLQAAVLAAKAGVPRVRIGDINAITNSHLGTFVRGVS
jgi:acetylglutamate kinase